MTNLYIKFRSFLYRLLYRILGRGLPGADWPYESIDVLEEKPGEFKSMVKVRKLEASRAGYVENVFDGDSIAHLSEPYFEGSGLRYSICMAIGGDTTGVLAERIPINTGLMKPERVVFHISGNNFAAGHSDEYIFRSFKEVIKTYKQHGVKEIAWLETVPLSRKHKSVHERITKFVERVKLSGLVEVIEIRQGLSDLQGFINRKYDIGDGIHVNKAAYLDIIVPAVNSWFISKGAKKM